MVDMTRLQAIYAAPSIPLHYGHLKPVEILANQIGLSKVIIMPNNVHAPLPPPEATSAQRVHMLKLAIADKPLFTPPCERELRRDTPPGRRKRFAGSSARNRGRASRLAFIVSRIRY